jgi:hypothetical protein
VLASRPRAFCSIVLDTVMAAVPIAPATRLRPMSAAKPEMPESVLIGRRMPGAACGSVNPARLRHRAQMP